MRKLYTLLIMLLAPLAALLAQPTIIVEDATACTGDNFCVEVTAEDFTNINSLDFDFGYDETALTFTGAQNFNPEMQADGNLGPALFDGSTPGVISFGTWETQNGDCLDPQNFGVTLDDGLVLFELCFEATGAYGAQSDIGINAFPTPLCTRNSTGCSNIGLLRQDGEVTLCVREFNVTAANVTGNEGDLVCVDFTVEGWDALNGIQFTVNYDPAFLQFENLSPNTEITSNTLAAYGLPGDINVDGSITVAYSYTIPDPSSISVLDGTTMFTACFTILGACETGTIISFSDDPTPIQVNNEDPDNPDENSEVPVSLNPGSVLVNDCDPEGIEIKIDCGPPVDINDIVCVQFQAGSNFNAVRRMEYLMTWNPNILEFIEVNTAGNLAGLDPGDFIEDNVGNGILGLDWEFIAGPPQNLDNMEDIYEVCFRVVGAGGDSPVQIITPGIGVSNGVNIGINPMNCVVEVNQPESVVVEFGSMDTPLNGTDCVPVTVSNFNDIISTGFTMNWDESIWLFTETQNLNPAIAANTTFTPVGASSLGFTFDNGSVPLTLDDNTVLFDICFQTAPTASPGDCSELTTVGLPFPESAVTATSNGDNIGLLVNPGDLCVLFPEGFGLEAVSTSGGWLDTVCMNFTVESFDNITAADFNVLWDVTELEFVSATAISWTDLVLNAPNPTGTLNATFNSPIPTAIPDGEVAFEMCFALVGDPNECYDVEIQNMPPPQVQTSNGQGSIVITNGEICVEERIVITDMTITPPSCPGACDGNITLEVAEWPGQGFIGTTWSFEYIPFMDFTPLMLEDVCEGQVIFTVFDNNSGVSFTDTVMMVSDGIVPEAVINGEDMRELDCAGGQIVVSTDSGGTGFSTLWYLNTTSSTPIGDTSPIFVSSPGKVILQVVDQISGCSSTDTIMVVTPGLPTAVIDEVTEAFDCNTGSITLNGGNSTGENLIYTWQLQVGGEFMVVGAGETFDATQPGTYRLSVENAVTGCVNDINDPNSVITIANNQVTPLACVELDGGGSNIQEQNCDGTPITFSAACTDVDGEILSYNWFVYDATSGEFGMDLGNGITVEVTDLGDYAVEIINEVTGCADTAFAQIIPNTNAPQVSIDPPAAFDCNTETLILNGSFSPSDDNFTFEWEATNGGVLDDPTILQPTVESPGTFRLIVTNPDNMCVGDSTVVVLDQTEPPFVEITNDPTELELNCVDATSITLRATPSQLLDYQWFTPDTEPGSEIPGETADTLVVTAPGTYIVQVTNPSTGCTNTATVEVTGQFETPQVILNETEVELTCTDSTITITAMIEGSTDFTLSDWTSTPADAIDDADILNATTIVVRSPGTYNLMATSNVSGCSNEADVVVSLNNTPPTVDVLADTLTISCLNEMNGVQLSGAGSSTGQDFAYTWENLTTGGGVVSTDIQFMTTEPGTYLFTVTNVNNGCTADTLVMVGTDLEGPELSIDPVEPITCLDPTRVLTVVATGTGPFIYEWSDGMPLDEASTTVDTTGTFTVTVTDSSNGCSSTAEITVDGDVTEPEVSIATPAEFDCPDAFVLVDGSATGDAADFSNIQWFLGITPLTGETDLTLEATELGSYTLEVTSAANGCTGSATVEVVAAAELTLPELPATLDIDLLGCDGDPVIIDASEADNGTDYLSVDWSTLDGVFTSTPDPFVIEATTAGVYTLTVVQNSPVMGCTNSMNYTVALDPNTPIADAGPDMVAECGDPAELDASGSTPPSATIVYSWEALPGSEPLTGDLQSPMPLAPGAGTYVLTVANTDNGCTATDTVSVIFEFPDAADAGIDDAACDDIADLSGNQPANTTGVWTTAGGATIDMPTNSITMVSGLSQGANTFTWTLSAPGCPDFSSDQVTITRANEPTALPDMLEMEFNQLTGTVNLLANDQLGGSTGFDLTITSGPAFGSFDTLALAQGDFVFTVLPNTFGVTQATYELCSTDCPDLCATATIDITVLPGDDNFVPNTITPNGDGANDNLVFDILLFNPAEDFPDNEIIIFNRWGDVIYEAQPYNNDWNGLSQDGTPVAEGTYYYVLRLNISAGEIIRGDITVIR